MIDISKTDMKSEEFAYELLKRKQVAVVPGIWKVSYFCNTVCIGSYSCYQFVLGIIVRAYAISCFDIFGSTDFKGNVCQASCNVLKEMFHNTFDVIQQGDLIEEFALLVYDQQCFRYMTFS